MRAFLCGDQYCVDGGVQYFRFIISLKALDLDITAYTRKNLPVLRVDVNRAWLVKIVF